MNEKISRAPNLFSVYTGLISLYNIFFNLKAMLAKPQSILLLDGKMPGLQFLDETDMKAVIQLMMFVVQ